MASIGDQYSYIITRESVYKAYGHMVQSNTRTTYAYGAEQPHFASRAGVCYNRVRGGVQSQYPVHA